MKTGRHAAMFFAALALLRIGPAAEIAGTGISVAFHDERGRLTHTVTARRGVLRGAQQKLEGVEVIYHDATQDTPQRVRADEALFDRTRNTLVGEGAVSVETATTRLSGEGFDFALVSSRLNIHRKFRLAHPDVVLTSERAIVTLGLEKSETRVRFHDVQRCEALEHLHLVFSASGRRKFLYDEAFSDLAIYDGVAQTLEMPHRVRAMRDGAPSEFNRVELDLKK